MGAEVMITGVSGGLGRAMTEHYLQQGDTVYGLSRRKPDIDVQGAFKFASVDLRDFRAVKEQINRLVTTQSLDLVVLNAGILGTFGDMTTTDLRVMQEVMEVNLWANKVILDTLFHAGITVRQVVAISSGASVSGARGWNGYGMSKAALNMMMKLYAAERPETHFSALAPGLINSSMQQYLCGLNAGDDYPVLKKLQDAQNTRYMPAPDEAARIVVACIAKLPEAVISGAYTDVREFTN